MKYYRYAKCMAGVKHPHLDLLIGKSSRVRMKKVEVSMGCKLTRDFDGICRYNPRSGRFSVCTHQRQTQRSDRARLYMYGQQMPSGMVSGPCSNPCMNTPLGRLPSINAATWLISMIHRLAAKAFRNILAKKQSQYRHVIIWLDEAIRRTKPDNAKEMWRLNRVVKEGDAVFLDYKF